MKINNRRGTALLAGIGMVATVAVVHAQLNPFGDFSRRKDAVGTGRDPSRVDWKWFADYDEAIDKTASMVSSNDAQTLAERHGLSLRERCIM